MQELGKQWGADALRQQASPPTGRKGWVRGALVGSALLVGATLVGCGAANTTGTTTSTGSSVTDPIVFQNTTMPAAYVGEPFTSSVAVLGGVGPYGYRVVSGTLPPGLKLSGTTLAGTPTTAGPYKFTVEVTDANLSTKVQEFTLNVNELAPLSIDPELPTGQIRSETRIPLKITAARNVRAARITWDLGPNVKVTKIQSTDAGNILLWQQDGSVLTVDVGFKTVPRSGTRIALVSVKPSQVVTLDTSKYWYDSRDGTGKVLGEKRPPAPPPDPKTLVPAPAAAPTNAAPNNAAPTTPGKTDAPADPNAAPTTPKTDSTTPTNPAGGTDPATPANPNPTNPGSGK